MSETENTPKSDTNIELEDAVVTESHAEVTPQEADAPDRKEEVTAAEDTAQAATTAEEETEREEQAEVSTTGNTTDDDVTGTGSEHSSESQHTLQSSEKITAEDQVERSYLKLPDITAEFHRAKAFMQVISPYHGVSLYDHLTELIYTVLEKRDHPGYIDIGRLSRKLLQTRFFPTDNNALQEVHLSSAAARLCRSQAHLFSTGNTQTIRPLDEGINQTAPDISREMFYLEQVGVALPPEESTMIQLSIARLIARTNIHSVRFWGKIFGTEKNYFIVEAEQMNPEELLNDLSMESVTSKEDYEEVYEYQYDEVEESGGAAGLLSALGMPEPSDPVAKQTKPPVVPSESYGSGVNHRVYYVTNGPGQCWYKLPHATPKHIVAARSICKLFSGNLRTLLHTYPPFPGTECEYLRAQIARITASTQVSPTGLYRTVGQDDDDDEEHYDDSFEDFADGDLRKNPEYERMPIRDLALSDLSGWVHHRAYILPQGRCQWWKPPKEKQTTEDEELEEEEEEMDENVEEFMEDDGSSETGPPLLTSLTEDEPVSGYPAWSVRLSSAAVRTAHRICSVHCVRWPGAVTYSDGLAHASIYLGWGVRTMVSGTDHSPQPPPPRDECFPPLSDINHSTDPAPLEEKAHQAAVQRKEEEIVQDEEEEGDEIYDEEDEEEEEEEY